MLHSYIYDKLILDIFPNESIYSFLQKEWVIPIILGAAIPLLLSIVGLLLFFIQTGIRAFLAYTIGESTMVFLCDYLTAPGVVFHELSHLFMCIITRAKILSFRLYHPSSDGTLGTVDFAARGFIISRSLQYFLISSAPVYFGIAIETVGILAFVKGWMLYWWQYALLMYLMICIFFHVHMSSQDLKVFAKGIPLFSLVVIFVLHTILW